MGDDAHMQIWPVPQQLSVRNEINTYAYWIIATGLEDYLAELEFIISASP